jgi:hypothetical protein
MADRDITLRQRDPRLGRHVQHDERSRAFAAAREVEQPAARVIHRHYGWVLDQGEVGSCTGNAGVHALMSGPLRGTRRDISRSQKVALALYTRATQLDPWPGEYPEADTGSSGLAVCKAMVEAGYITRYEWAFGIDHVDRALVNGPLMIGTAWYEGMSRPDRGGMVAAVGQQMGGHEYVCLGRDHDIYGFVNSWSKWWGVKDRSMDVSGGAFFMHRDTFAALLEDYGDAVQPLA